VTSVPRAPLLELTLRDGRRATLLLGETSTVLSVEETLVSSWDLAGRPYALVRGEATFRRGLDGRLLEKGPGGARTARVRRRLSAAEGEPVVEAARAEAAAALAVVPAGGDRDAARRLSTVVAMGPAALRDDAARFRAACGPVGVLPPDQYLALVVRLTEGCSWSACTFCTLYRGIPFRAKSREELRAHLEALRRYFGASLVLRRSVFLGDANALCLSTDRLLPLLRDVHAAFPEAPLFSFLDAWTGRRRSEDDWRACAALGLRRVYVGLETGDPDLLAWLGKAGSPADAVDLVRTMHRAGVAAGVIVLLGAGGRRFAGAHATRTAEVLSRMDLGPEDLLYFSEYVEEEGSEYGRRAAGTPDLQPLEPGPCAAQRQAILERYRPGDPARPPRVATYDIREFVY
jgi:hypothetical protein